MKVNFPGGGYAVIDEKVLEAAAIAKFRKNLIAAAVDIANNAKRICGKDTYQLYGSIHVIKPGETDTSFPNRDKDGNTCDAGTGLSAGPTEAYVAAKTFAHLGGKSASHHDYSWFHDVGTSVTPANGYLTISAEMARKKYPGVAVGTIQRLE